MSVPDIDITAIIDIFTNESIRDYTTTFFASLCSCLISLLVMKLTLRSQNKSSKEALDESKNYHKQIIARQKERDRVSQLPYLNLKYDNYITDEQGKIFWFTIQNVGNGAALEIKMDEYKIIENGIERSVISKNELMGEFYTLYDIGESVFAHRALPVGQPDHFALMQHLNPSISTVTSKITIRFTYKDTYYNDYEQIYKIGVGTWTNDTGAWIIEAPLPQLLT